ncbi:tyrosine-type recombinase/integrase [Georgenia satyanarayanai]|uniref:tyrosine-type recombinase/integrase n=1 Tax=Georgenia satyanarayanai TaxID=860221 RepID=UPI00203E43A0|nr:tyrosine-type recombinase/integrase [Georgenia satyanarayanai]
MSEEPLEGGLHLIRPKSRAGWRTLPLPPGLAELVAQRVDAAGREANQHGLLFTRSAEDGPLTGRPIEPKSDTEAWGEVAKRAGITRAGTLHEARHTTATLLQSLGVEESLRVEILGHSSITTTRNYQHADIRLRSSALGKLASTLGLASALKRPRFSAALMRAAARG